MVGESDPKNDTLFDGLVFISGNGRAGVIEEWKTENTASCLVSKRGCDVFGCARVRQATNMGAAEFSNIGKRVGDNKSTALIPGMFEDTLCFVT